MKPRSSRSSSRSFHLRPAPTVIVMSSSLMVPMTLSPVSSRTMPPFVGMVPPYPHEEAPLGTIGTRFALAYFMISETSSSFRGLTTTSGIVLKIMEISEGRGAMSWSYSRLSNKLSDTLFSPTIFARSSLSCPGVNFSHQYNISNRSTSINSTCIRNPPDPAYIKPFILIRKHARETI